MLIFVAAGLVIEGSSENEEQVECWRERYRRWNQSLRFAREAGNFGEIVRYEQFIEKDAQWLRSYLMNKCGVPETALTPLEPYLADEKRMIRHRTEYCTWCWYGVGFAPKEWAQQPGSNRWPEKTVTRRRLRPSGKIGWAIAYARVGS